MPHDGFPLVVGWELTLACNLRCRHCASSAGLSRTHELTTAEALAICDQFPALLVQEVDFTGGEPLLRSDWPLLAHRLRELDIWTQVVTNGLLLGPEVVARMKDEDIKAVGVSLDGLEATHDRIRGLQGLFRRVLAGVERVQAAGIHVCVITAANTLNVGDLPELLALLQSVGVNHWQIQPLFPTGRASGDDELVLTPEVYLQLGAFVQRALPAAQRAGFTIELADSYGYCGACDLRASPWRGCVAGIVACGITSDGKVKGCLSMPAEFVEGDLRERRLWDIWFEPEAFAYTRQFRPDLLGPNCRDCAAGETCKGGCSMMSWGSTHSLHNDPYCFLGISNRAAALVPAH